MLGVLPGVSQEEHEGTLKVTGNGRNLVLHCPQGNHVTDVQELMDLRHFLQGACGSSPQPVAHVGAHLLVVIDHRMARIYKSELHGSMPERLIPYDRGGFDRHLHYVEENGSGQRKPEQKTFYEAVARTLQGAQEILLFGSGTGASSAMEHLLAALRRDHHDLADRVVGSIVVDEHHLTEDQLLAMARDFYAGRRMHETRYTC
jgi:hypothetical protein